jgi:hypothetical protein
MEGTAGRFLCYHADFSLWKNSEGCMLIRYGFDIELDLYQATTLIAEVDVHPSRRGNILHESEFRTTPSIPVETFTDHFGNMCRRLTARSGPLALQLQGTLYDDGDQDGVDWTAEATPVPDLPPDVLPFIFGSRYCESDLLSGFAWSNFGHIKGGGGESRRFATS